MKKFTKFAKFTFSSIENKLTTNQKILFSKNGKMYQVNLSFYNSSFALRYILFHVDGKAILVKLVKDFIDTTNT